MRARVPQTRVDLLRGVPLFSACSQKELAWIDGLCVEVDVEAGIVLMEEGEEGQQAFIVIDGTAGVMLRGEHLATLGPGDAIGEMALVELAPRTATVVAATRMRLLVLGRREFATLLTNSSITCKMLRATMQRLRELEAAYV